MHINTQPNPSLTPILFSNPVNIYEEWDDIRFSGRTIIILTIEYYHHECPQVTGYCCPSAYFGAQARDTAMATKLLECDSRYAAFGWFQSA